MLLSMVKDIRVILMVIRETGNHQELLAKRGLYHKLYLLQHPEQALPEKR